MTNHTQTVGIFNIRQTGYEYVVEEFRNGIWVIIESLPSRSLADIAYREYRDDGHSIVWLP